MRTKTKMWTMGEINYIEQHLNEMSNKEMARALGVKLPRVKDICRYYCLRRNEEGTRRAYERRATKWLRLHKEEKERARQGLPQLTKLKINKKFLAKYQRV